MNYIADWEQTMNLVLEKINILSSKKTPVVVGIDGRCASGKTTFASELQMKSACTVFHADDFYLPMNKRMHDHEASAEGNLDYERMVKEVFMPIQNGRKTLEYRPYSCQKQEVLAPITEAIMPVVIIEGSYCCHPMLWDYYDLHIFVSVKKEVQLSRIQKRNGLENAELFETRWIPMEERYIAKYLDDKAFDFVIQT